MPQAYRKLPILSPQEITRFWSYVDIRQPDECWPWKRATDKDGYGVVGFQCFSFRAHRVALYLATAREFPQALHSCDNPPCCNPAHLKGGDNRKNIDDMLNKGRSKVGSLNHCAKLNEDQVREIRRRYAPKTASCLTLAREYGVAEKTIWDIIHRNKWTHI